MLKKSYSDFIVNSRNILNRNNKNYIDCTKEDFPSNDTYLLMWKKYMLKLSNSNDLEKYLKSSGVVDEFKNIICQKYSNISEYRLNENNCLVLRNKLDALKTICLGNNPVPIFSPNYLHLYNFNKNFNESSIIKPQIDTNLEPGFFEYKYEKIYMINSSYVIIQNPDPLTGRVLSANEIINIRDNLLQRNCVLIIDASLGNLYPNLIHKKDIPPIVEGVIYFINFYPLGLIGDEISIVISNKMIIDKINEFISRNNNSILFGKSSPLILKLIIESIKSDELFNYFSKYFINEIITRYSMLMNGIIENISYNYPVYVYNSKAGTSLWIYLKDLPISDTALVNILKSKNVLVNPGSFFFPNNLQSWNHSHKCINLNINGCFGKEYEIIEIMNSVISNCYKGRS